MPHFRIKGSDGLKVEGDFEGRRPGDDVKAKFRSKKTSKVYGEIIGKVDGKFTARPRTKLEKKIKNSKKWNSIFISDKKKVSEKDFKKVAEKAFDKIKDAAHDAHIPTSHMRLKVKMSS